MKRNNILTKIVTLSLITVSVMYASRLVQTHNTLPKVTYHDMDMIQLQKAVEKHSQQGDLSFDMGIELIKRWTHK